MPVTLHKPRVRRLKPKELAPWRELRTPIVSDAMNRAQTLDAGIRPIAPGLRLVGQALTVRAIAADITPLLYALAVARPGDVLVVDAGGHVDNAVLGGHMNHEARRRGIAGLVIDGSIRDVAEIRASGMPAFSRGITPAGPHAGRVGDVNAPVSCGGVAVSPGDLVLGDDDGVVVVPLARLGLVLQACRRHLETEAEWERRITAGEAFRDILELPAAEPAEATK